MSEQHSPLPDASLLNHSLSSGRLGSWASAGVQSRRKIRTIRIIVFPCATSTTADFCPTKSFKNDGSCLHPPFYCWTSTSLITFFLAWAVSGLTPPGKRLTRIALMDGDQSGGAGTI